MCDDTDGKVSNPQLHDVNYVNRIDDCAMHLYYKVVESMAVEILIEQLRPPPRLLLLLLPLPWLKKLKGYDLLKDLI